MSEKKRTRKRKDEYTGPGEQQIDKPSKDEYKVAKWMKKYVKTKKTKFLNHNVQYFTSNKAIDALMKSKFAQGDDALFQTREHAIELLDIMLEHKFYHRAKKVPVTLEELRGGAAAASGKSTKKEEKSSTSKKEDAATKKDTEAEAEASGANNGGEETNSAGGDKKEKRKRKIRLDMHPEQLFVDGSEAYVWIYDPVPIHYWIFGLIVVLGAIGVCLFPLWPQMLRKGVYYLSVAAAGFLVFILVLTIVRMIIFTVVWALTAGKMHFWIFPNLTEDVGFFASFWPLYESKYVADNDKSKSEKRSKSKSKKKDKDSDAEEDTAPDADQLEPEKIEEIKEHDADMELRRRNVDGDATGDAEEESHSSGEAAAESDAKGSGTPSESESSDGKDYEIISTSEVQNVN